MENSFSSPIFIPSNLSSNPGKSFASPKIKGLHFDEKDQKDIEKVAGVLKRMTLSGKYLLHTPANWYDDWVKHAVNANYFCTYPHGSLTVDTDGTLRLCYRAKGKEVTKFNVFDIGKKEVEEAFKKDREERCQGCCWNCAQMVDRFLKDDPTGKKGREWFRHEVVKNENEIRRNL